jgi:hypothetical protein
MSLYDKEKKATSAPDAQNEMNSNSKMSNPRAVPVSVLIRRSGDIAGWSDEILSKEI